VLFRSRLLEQLLRTFLVGLARDQEKWRNNARRLQVVVNLADQKEQHRAVNHRHLKIENEKIVPFLERQFEAVLRARRRVHIAAEATGKGFPHNPQQSNVVIDHQDLRGFARFHQLHACAKCRAVSSFNAMDSSIQNRESLSALAAALKERLAVIGDEASRRNAATHVARLKAVSERIEALEKSLPGSIDPRLRHYLERRSYEKALEWIESSIGF